MMFHCLPPDSRYEWDNLRGFVAQYNERYGKKYNLSACPEKVNRNTKEPEVALEAIGESPIVIERKSIVWPPGKTYMADHHKSHQLLEDFVRRFSQRANPFTGSAYQLSVSAMDLEGKRKEQVASIAEQIADVALSNPVEAQSRRGVGGREPIPWRFRLLSPEESDSNTGIGIDVLVRDFGEPWESPQQLEEERLGYSEEFGRWAEEAAEKFARYPDHRKLFLVQFFGEVSADLEDEELIEIVRSAHLPETIDEVWVARMEWVNLDEFEIAWDHVR